MEKILFHHYEHNESKAIRAIANLFEEYVSWTESRDNGDIWSDYDETNLVQLIFDKYDEEQGAPICEKCNEAIIGG